MPISMFQMSDSELINSYYKYDKHGNLGNHRKHGKQLEIRAW